jgi:hypothetical protein
MGDEMYPAEQTPVFVREDQHRAIVANEVMKE